jgi:uncharacterized membrane protein YhaH (DUF805 family)
MLTSIGRALGLTAFLASLALNLGLVVSALADPDAKSDLKAEYLMATALANGVNPYTSLDVLAETWLPGHGVGRLAHPTPHPIFVGWLFLPLAGVPFPQAAVTWFLVELGCLAGCAWLWCTLEGRRVRGWQIALIVSGLLAWFPLAMELRLGQLSVLLLTLFLGSWLALRRGHEATAGACLGTMVLLKLAAIPVLLWLALRGRWRAVASAVALVATAHLVAVGLHGWSLVTRYYTVVGPQVAQEYRTTAANLSAWSLATRLVGLDTTAVMVPLVALAALVGLAWRARRWDTSLPALMAGGLFLSPIAWVHTFVMALPALAVLGRRLHARAWPWWPTTAAVVAGALVSLPEVFYVEADLIIIPALALVSLVGLLLSTEPGDVRAGGNTPL